MLKIHEKWQHPVHSSTKFFSEEKFPRSFFTQQGTFSVLSSPPQKLPDRSVGLSQTQSARGYRHYAKFTTRTVRKMGNILGGDTGPPKRKQKNSEFLQPPMARPRGAGGMGASGPNRPQPDRAE